MKTMKWLKRENIHGGGTLLEFAEVFLGLNQREVLVPRHFTGQTR